MSSFLHDVIHFNSVIESLNNSINKDTKFKIYPPYELVKIYKEFPMKKLREIFRTLYALSSECVAKQYKHYSIEDTEFDIEKFDTLNSSFVNISSIGLLKALQSIEYQIEIDEITEGSITYQSRNLTTDETNALFFLKTIISEVAQKIVMETKEYDNFNTYRII